MAVAVPCAVGLLTALCLALLLLGDRGATLRVPGRLSSGALRSCAQSVGAFLAGVGITPRSRAGRILLEIRHVEFGRHKPFSDFDDRAAMGTVPLICLAVGAVLFLLTLTPLALPVGIAAPVVLLAVHVSSRRRQEARRLEESMPEAFGSLALSLGSGLSLPQAMRYVGAHSDEPVRTEFMRVSFAIDCGISAVEALDGMLERLRAPGLDLVVLALKVSQRTGAPLSDLLNEATQMVEEQIELRRTLDVKTSQARMSARLVACMPLLMVALLSLLSSDFREGLATPLGAGAVALGLVLDVFAMSIIRKIMDVGL